MGCRPTQEEKNADKEEIRDAELTHAISEERLPVKAGTNPLCTSPSQTNYSNAQPIDPKQHLDEPVHPEDSAAPNHTFQIV